MDPFCNLVSDSRAFLGELAANNSREWFNEHKTRYESELKTPAVFLLKHISHDVGRDWGIELKTKLFRPHRDVRFSKDKTPYHSHLHMLWILDMKHRQNPGLFFGISPDYVRIGGGIMEFDKTLIANWREAINGSQGDEIQSRLKSAAEYGFQPGDLDLKRVPTPYDKNHRHADLLRRKGLTIWRDLTEAEMATPLSTITFGANQMRPVLEAFRTIS